MLKLSLRLLLYRPELRWGSLPNGDHRSGFVRKEGAALLDVEVVVYFWSFSVVSF